MSMSRGTRTPRRGRGARPRGRSISSFCFRWTTGGGSSRAGPQPLIKGKLIWGDNKLILSSLKNGPLREEIEAQGGIKLIYIDLPSTTRGDDTFTKKSNILEEIAYGDTWESEPMSWRFATRCLGTTQCS